MNPINSAFDVIAPGSWTDLGGGKYYIVPGYGVVVQMMARNGNLVPKGTSSSVANDQFYYAGGEMWYATPTGHTISEYTIEASRRFRAVYINGKDYITFNGIDVQGGNAAVYATDGDMFDIVDSTHITLTNNNAKYSWLSGISAAAQTKNVDYLSISNSTASYSANHGLGLGGSNSYGFTNLTLSNLTIHHIGQFVNDSRGYGSIDREGIGINGNGNSSNITLSDILVHDVGDTTADNDVGIFLYQVNFTTLTRFLVYNCARMGIEISDGTGPYGQNVVLQDGIVRNNGSVAINNDDWSGGIILDNENSGGMGGTAIYNTVIYGNSGAASSNANKQAGLLIYKGFTTANSAAITIKNNIIAQNVTNDLQVYENTGALSGLTLDYNLYYRASGTAVVFDTTSYDYQHVIGGSSGFYSNDNAKDSHSLDADPKFTNAVGNDFTLQSTSPAIDAGTNLGSPYNMGLDPRTSFPWSTIDQGIYGSWEIGAFVYVPNLGSGNQTEPRYDFLNNSATSATSNHTLVFTVQNSLDNTGGSASDTLALTFQSNFNLSNITCGDVNVATGTRFLFNVASPEPRTNCPNTTTSWGLLVNTASRTITITVPASVRTYVATGTILTVSIGSNANYQNQGGHWIINPTDSGTKSITIGGTFGGYGQILVSVNPALQLSASIAETLTLTLTGLGGSGTGGMNSCSSDGTHDAEDNASINLINTTAASVPFGTLGSANTFYEGCQKVSVTTNAGSGFTVAVREDHSLRTASGLTVADTGCDASGCLNTPSTAGAWVTNTNPGLGISCAQAATSASCSTVNPNWINGTRWAPIANEGENNSIGGTETPAIFSGLSVATSVEVITKAKYRIAVPAVQTPGTYTNLVSLLPRRCIEDLPLGRAIRPGLCVDGVLEIE